MQTIKTKRKRYDPITYGQLTGNLSRLLDATPHLTFSRNEWDLEGDWSKAGDIHFIDMVHQAAFKEYADFDCRIIKIVNLDRPAVRLTFFPVHRYWLLKDKDLPKDERQRRIIEYINTLTAKIEESERKLTHFNSGDITNSRSVIIAMGTERTKWTNILNDLDNYEVAISNYEQGHTYSYVNWKYIMPSGELTNEQMHLLSNQRDRDGNVTQYRHNIIFVDPVEILRDHPHQHKKVHLFLTRFPDKSRFIRDMLYVRERPWIDDININSTIDIQQERVKKIRNKQASPPTTLSLFPSVEDDLPTTPPVNP